MTEEEAIVHYLRTFAGQRVSYCRMLNVLADNMTGYVKGKFPVHRDIRRATWSRLRNAANRLMKARVVIRHRTPQVANKGRRPTVRLNAAFERNQFYRRHE